MAMFRDYGLNEMYKRFMELENRVQQQSAAVAPAPTRNRDVTCPHCHKQVRLLDEHLAMPLYQVTCGACRCKLAISPITIEFCVWLQNEWAEEIKNLPAEENQMNKLFDAQSWRNRLTALGVILDLKPLPEDVTLRVPADQIDQVSCGHGARRDSATTTTVGVHETPAGTNLSPKYDGNLLPSMTAMVTGFVDKLAKFYSPCPQGKDCAGDQKHNRIFACDHCEFVGCSSCLDLHESAGHESDSSTAREQYSGLRLIDGEKQ